MPNVEYLYDKEVNRITLGNGRVYIHEYIYYAEGNINNIVRYPPSKHCSIGKIVKGKTVILNVFQALMDDRQARRDACNAAYEYTPEEHEAEKAEGVKQ